MSIKRRQLQTTIIVIIMVLSLGLEAIGCTALQVDAPSPSAGDSQRNTATNVTSGAQPPVTEMTNARQVAGYRTKDNRVVRANLLWRSGAPAGLTAEEIIAIQEAANLTDIIDFRDEVEVEEAPDASVEGVGYHHLNAWPSEARDALIAQCTTSQGFDSAAYTQSYYEAFALDPSAISAYKEMFALLLEKDAGSFLLHCYHGNDRTGIAITLILSALQVDWEQIEEEYLLSNLYAAGSVNLANLRYYRELINANYGNIDSYLAVEMGLNAEALKILAEKYTLAGS